MAKVKSPAFSFYVRDWLCSKTVSKLHSKPHSKGVSCYLYLLCSSWLEEPPATLPDDDIELASLGRVSIQEWKELKPIIILQFPLLPSGRRSNGRLMEEWEKQQKRKASGSLGGLAKSVAKHVAALEDATANENNTSEIPTWEEFWEYCKSLHCGLAAEWYARDKWEAANVDRWSKKSDWRAYARRCKGWWQNDGSPMMPPQKNGSAPAKKLSYLQGPG